MQKMSKQGGFTLVEIAIVLVIIGLLLGGVLKGQEMIKNAEIRNVISDVRGLSTAMYAYRDRYNAMPGDDGNAQVHLSDTTLTNGDNDGLIDTAERPDFFEHLRAAKLIKGTGSAIPNHSLGGTLTAQNGGNGLVGTVFCAATVLGEDALLIDLKEDDGIPSTGSVRGHGTLTAYVPTSNYTLCIEP